MLIDELSCRCPIISSSMINIYHKTTKNELFSAIQLGCIQDHILNRYFKASKESIFFSLI
ncbi:hypothetical protein CLV99_1857 [Sphingobacterium yanglingense]|uniref:Uncharacterized protein n=1 Tax=Sphingobacterium yanglingense TaxID=1437280 RepID=A0A4V3DDS3_9SPHI|nr:hypothetical protein CLV99_1857 [Sphingobacterium yanglingense]